ncbi:hypothetical protein NKH77_47575 [Streptomyces sp. M19]
MLSLLTGVDTTIELVRRTGRALPSARLWFGTRGAVSVDASDPAGDPREARIWGLGQALALQHPTRWGGAVDLPEPGYGTSAPPSGWRRP